MQNVDIRKNATSSYGFFVVEHSPSSAPRGVEAKNAKPSKTTLESNDQQLLVPCSLQKIILLAGGWHPCPQRKEHAFYT